jgi:KaiC/GvpD/RAD55 family RecA-like ATPase
VSSPRSTPRTTQRPPPSEVEPESIDRVPWSVVGPEFIDLWGYPKRKFWPEHVEILGPSGSGKTYFDATILTERVARRKSRVVFIATKKADDTILKLGWPIVDRAEDVRRHEQCVFWPQTSRLGAQRKAYLLERIQHLLEYLWQGDANIIVAFDEIATVESLGLEMRELVQMYWREARSNGITVVGMKQRPQGTQRDMHSETTWVVAFRPKDEDDAKRYAEVLGGRARWMPVLMALDRSAHEFILANAATGHAVISWVDVTLRPAPPANEGTYRRP